MERQLQLSFVFSETEVKWELPQQKRPPPPPSSPSTIRIISWNVDYMASEAAARLAGLLTGLEKIHSSKSVDVICLQEVSCFSLDALRDSPWVQQNWSINTRDHTNWHAGYGTVTLVNLSSPIAGAHVGNLRIPYKKTRFQRDALCSDFVFSEENKLRIISTHLDSLDYKPNRRPSQLATCKKLLEEKGNGLVLGDFNMILEEDKSLISDCGLVDAWEVVHKDEPEENGYTWGIQLEERYPPKRLDRIAVFNVEPVDVEVLKCDTVDIEDEPVLWSDHCGLLGEVKL